MKKLKLVLLVLLFSSSLVCMEDHAGAGGAGGSGNLSGAKRKKADGEVAAQIQRVNLSQLPDMPLKRILEDFDYELVSPVCKRFNQVNAELLKSRWSYLKALTGDSFIPTVIDSMNLSDETKINYKHFKNLYVMLSKLGRQDVSLSVRPQVADITHPDVFLALDKVVLDKVSSNERLLIISATLGYLDLVKLLLSKGVDVDFADDTFGNRTALVCAARYGHAEVVKALLDGGAGDDTSKSNALRSAIYNKRTSVVSVFLEAGMDVNSDEILFSAIEYGGLNIMKILLEKNPDVNVKSSWGSTALIEGSKGKAFKIVEALLKKGADVNALDNKGKSALMYAAKQGCLNIVNLLLKHGAKLDIVSKDGKTPIHMAFRSGKIEVFKDLLSKNVNIDLVDNKGKTLIMKCSGLKHLDFIDMLLQMGIDINAVDSQGSTALIHASSNHDVGMVNVLLAKGADVNIVNNAGQTALTSALNKGYMKVSRELVQVLLDKGADIPEDISVYLGFGVILKQAKKERESMVQGCSFLADALFEEGL